MPTDLENMNLAVGQVFWSSNRRGATKFVVRSFTETHVVCEAVGLPGRFTFTRKPH